MSTEFDDDSIGGAEWPTGDMHLADAFRDVDDSSLEPPGADASQSILEDDGVPSLRSVSIYAFDIDKRLLRIEDYDCLLVYKDQPLEPGSYPVKRISRRTSGFSAELRSLRSSDKISWSSSTKNFLTALVHAGRVDNTVAQLGRKDSLVSLDVEKELIVGEKNHIVLRIAHTISLEGYGKNLFFCGAVQPSDYAASRSHFGIERARKIIKLRAWSSNGFEAWVFKAADQRAYPPTLHSRRERVYYIEEYVSVAMPEWERARYFGLFVQQND